MVTIQPKLEASLKYFQSLFVDLYSCVVTYITLLAQVDTVAGWKGAKHLHFAKRRHVVDKNLHSCRIEIEEVWFVDESRKMITQLQHGWYPFIFAYISKLHQHSGYFYCYQPRNIRGKLRETPVGSLGSGNLVSLIHKIKVVVHNNTTMLISFLVVSFHDSKTFT